MSIKAAFIALIRCPASRIFQEAYGWIPRTHSAFVGRAARGRSAASSPRSVRPPAGRTGDRRTRDTIDRRREADRYSELVEASEESVSTDLRFLVYSAVLLFVLIFVQALLGIASTACRRWRATATTCPRLRRLSRGPSGWCRITSRAWWSSRPSCWRRPWRTSPTAGRCWERSSTSGAASPTPGSISPAFPMCAPWPSASPWSGLVLVLRAALGALT